MKEARTMGGMMVRASVIVMVIGGPWCGIAEARQVQRPGATPGRFSDPYANVHAWPRPATGNDAFMFFLASQYQAAQRSRASAPASAAVDPSPPRMYPYHQMQPGGASVGSYFGRTGAAPIGAGPATATRFNRLGHRFGNQGR